MSSKQHRPPMQGPRRPPKPNADLAVVEEFVRRSDLRSDPEPRKRRGSIHQRTDGREVEQMTIYLPPDLAQRLRIAAITERVDMSSLVAAALESKL